MYNVIYKSYLLIPKGGLRTAINEAKAAGHVASDWKTLWHGTPERNVPSILKQGFLSRSPLELNPVFLARKTKPTMKVKGFYAGRRSTASIFGTDPRQALLKFQVPKKDLAAGTAWTRSSSIRDPDNIMGNLFGKESFILAGKKTNYQPRNLRVVSQ